jgi:hypothetical protein
VRPQDDILRQRERRAQDHVGGHRGSRATRHLLSKAICVFESKSGSTCDFNGGCRMTSCVNANGARKVTWAAVAAADKYLLSQAALRLRENQSTCDFNEACAAAG